ncbi:MAG TPA: ATP-binding cassette domain-containing protein, partial [Chitinophagaceae bacterium]|nr:ATP-binding cassette domain-containing protein [Chitinophagaceae bacterium]
MHGLLPGAAKTGFHLCVTKALHPMMPLLHILDLSINFIKEDETTAAVRNINLEINRGEIVALVGESGSGKSVTSLAILQLLPVPPARYVQGKIMFSENENPIDLLQLKSRELQQIRGNKIGMIFQEPMSSLNPVISCGKQVMEALLLHKNLPAREAKKKVIEWFERVDLPSPHLLFDRYPHQLSGGQKQRVMIAMAMCCDPHLLICDEPTTALDVTVQKSVLELIRKLQQEQNIGVLFITHDLGLVAQFANRVAIMYKGEIIEHNTVSAIFNQPHHPYTKALLACRPALHPKGEKLPIVSDFIEGKTLVNKTVVQPQVNISNVPSTILVHVKNITVKFPVRKNILGKAKQYYTAVDDVSFIIKKGETLGLVGES